MSALESLALVFGRRDRSGAAIVPAGQLAAFLTEARAQGIDVPYVECLYLGADFTEPSMELSGELADFRSWEAFVVFATEAAREASARALEKGAEAVFEVGP